MISVYFLLACEMNVHRYGCIDENLELCTGKKERNKKKFPSRKPSGGICTLLSLSFLSILPFPPPSSSSPSLSTPLFPPPSLLLPPPLLSLHSSPFSIYCICLYVCVIMFSLGYNSSNSVFDLDRGNHLCIC